MYAALTVDDGDRLNQLFAPTFVAFDAGKRFTGPALITLIESAHAAGKQYVWNIVAPEVHVSCELAWLTWENRGSITDAGTTRNVLWLESAVLTWVDGRWRILFFHSTRAAEA